MICKCITPQDGIEAGIHAHATVDDVAHSSCLGDVPANTKAIATNPGSEYYGFDDTYTKLREMRDTVPYQGRF